jgi:hypothetical protein
MAKGQANGSKTRAANGRARNRTRSASANRRKSPRPSHTDNNKLRRRVEACAAISRADYALVEASDVSCFGGSVERNRRQRHQIVRSSLKVLGRRVIGDTVLTNISFLVFLASIAKFVVDNAESAGYVFK